MINDRLVSDLLYEIFSEGPTTNLTSYLTSAMMDVRRAMSSHSFLVHDRVIDRAPTLPTWLQSDYLIPPWETHLLDEIFTYRPIVVVQGGSGCGKSSVCHFLRHYCERLHRQHEEHDLSYATYPPSLLTIDLQDQPEEFTNKLPTEHERTSQTERFLHSFAEALDAQLQDSISEAVFPTLFESVFLNAGERQTVMTRSRQVQLSVRTTYREQNPYGRPTPTNVRAALDSLPHPHDRVAARYLLFNRLANLMLEKQGRGLALVIDNVDPFPEYLQAALIRTFEATAHSANFHSEDTSAFTIVLFARLSTSTKHSGALDGVRATRVSFHSPEPADLVFFRLTSFLLSPETFSRFATLQPAVQKQLLARMWCFWERMVDHEGDFDRILSGLAGTNGRIAQKLSRWWIQSPRLQAVSPPRPEEHITLKRAVAGALLERLASSATRSIDAVYQQYAETTQGTVENDEEGLAVLLSEQTLRVLFRVFLDYRLGQTCNSRNLIKEDVRSAVSQSARQLLLALFDEDDKDSIRSSARWLIKRSIAKVESHLSTSGQSPDRFRKALEANAGTLAETLSQVISDLSTDSRLLAERLLRLFTDSITISKEEDLPSDRTTGELIAGIIEKTRETGHNSPSRWQANSILISPDAIDKRTEKSAVNLFSADGKSISPVALHVLCLLEEYHGGVHAAVLRERLEEWSFSHGQVLSALTDMVHPDRRLVYSGVKDLRDGVASWFQDSSTMVHISSAGSGYLRYVCPNPAYLQWALIEPAVIREGINPSVREKALKTALGRLELALTGLALLRQDEVQRAMALRSRLEKDLDRSLSPLAWVFFAGLGRFMRDVAAQRNHHRKAAEELAVRWLQFGSTLLLKHQELFGAVPPEWESTLALEEHSFRQRFKIDPHLDIFV